MADLCEPYPIPIICELLGAPKEDWKLFAQWAPDILRIFNFNIAEDLPIIMKAQDELSAYALDLIADRRTRPGDDLITALIQAEEAGDRLSSEELAMMCEAVLVAGTDTTRNQLACAMALLAQHPDQWALLGERPELASRAVEETMRLLGAVRGTARIAAEDVEYRGVVFPAGTLVDHVVRRLANTDPTVFADPLRFDITRERSSAPTHVRQRHPLLPRRVAGPGRAAGGPRRSSPSGCPASPSTAPIEWKPNTAGIWGPARLRLRFDPDLTELPATWRRAGCRRLAARPR